MLFLFCIIALVTAETLNTEALLSELYSELDFGVDISLLKAKLTKRFQHRSAYCKETVFGSCEDKPKKLAGCDELITTESRLAVFISNATANNVPIVVQIGDTFHQRAIAASRGMYTNATFAVFDQESMDSFAETMGPCFDFRNQTYIPGLAGVGGWFSPCGNVVLIPYIIGVNESLPGETKYVYSVMFDSAYLDQGESDNRWRILAAGNVAVILGNASTTNISTPQGNFYGGNAIGYANYAQVNLDCPEWDSDDTDCVVNNLILPPSVSFQFSPTPYPFQYSNFQISFTPLVWENACCQRGTGTIDAYLAGPNFDFRGQLNKYQITTLILPNEC